MSDTSPVPRSRRIHNVERLSEAQLGTPLCTHTQSWGHSQSGHHWLVPVQTEGTGLTVLQYTHGMNKVRK